MNKPEYGIRLDSKDDFTIIEPNCMFPVLSDKVVKAGLTNIEKIVATAYTPILEAPNASTYRRQAINIDCYGRTINVQTRAYTLPISSLDYAQELSDQINDSAITNNIPIEATPYSEDGSNYSIKITSLYDFTYTLTRGDIPNPVPIGAVFTNTVLANATSEAEIFRENNTLDSIDVTTRESAEKAIIITDYALAEIGDRRSKLGSAQQKLESTIRNISVTQVNVKNAESQIRDVDFAKESANFNKQNILAQSGTYAISQANVTQQNVLKLLQ